MTKKTIYFSALHAILIIVISLSSCMSTKTALVSGDDDDVYYPVAQAKEAVQPVYAKEEREVNGQNYVTEDELYGDNYNYSGNMTDYTARFYRFRNYSPFLGYYNSLYGYNYYDPFFNSSYYPYSYFGSPAINMGLTFSTGYYYNPWRFYGYNYGSPFWGPYSYYNTWSPYGWGGGYYNRGYYSGIYSSPAFSSPNYRSRPNRTIDNLSSDRGSVIGNPGGVIIKDNNGNIIQSRGRAERYGDEIRNNPSGNRTSTSRPQPVARPDRVNQAPPQRATQPERIYSAPRQDPGSGSRGSSAPSNSGGGGNSGGARPSRGN